MTRLLALGFTVAFLTLDPQVEREPVPRCLSHGHMPDGVCSPGDVLTSDKGILCGQSSRERRAVTESERREVFEAYRLRDDGDYVLDHRVPLCLGGSNGFRNTWPEWRDQSEEKDRLEASLCRAVCAGRVRLEVAQSVFLGDWEGFSVPK